MSRYLLDLISADRNSFSGTVAQIDVRSTLKDIGTTFLDINRRKVIYSHNIRGIMIRISNIIESFIALRVVSHNDYVYFQYPYSVYPLSTIVQIAKKRGAKIVFIIHDLNFLRWKDSKDKWTDLNLADYLLVHTNQMAEELRRFGVKTEMIPITLFDYYSKDDYRDLAEQAKDRNIIAFAGNLNKSELFLKKLQASNIPPGFSFNLYGISPNYNIDETKLNYQGKFLSEHTAAILAGWGLVWDGDGIDSCSGNLGNYLKVIAPHKLSLYIASGIPVIVWSNSAHAKFVEENEIGFSVNTISEIYNLINDISDEKYIDMVMNTRRIGNKLRVGGYLKKAIMKVEQ